MCGQPIADGVALVGDAVSRHHGVTQHLMRDGAAQQLRDLLQALQGSRVGAANVTRRGQPPLKYKIVILGRT